MIDTIKGYLDIKPKENSNFKELISEAKISTSDSGYTASLNLSNMKITFILNENYKPYKLYFNGSLSKFHFGNNLLHLNRKTIKEAVNMLSDNINVNMKKAILTRVDYGYNIEVDYSVHEYISSLISFPRLETNRYKDSVTFFTKWASKSLIFYDKIKELKNGNKEVFYSIPIEYHNKNILRYEIRLKKNLKQRFNLEQVYLKSLFDDTVQNKLKELWLKDYHKVNKLSIGKDPVHLLYRHSGLYQYLSYHGIDKLGFDEVINIISDLDFDVINPRSKRSKMKSVVKELLKEVSKNTLEKNLVRELDIKIRSVKDLIF